MYEKISDSFLGSGSLHRYEVFARIELLQSDLLQYTHTYIYYLKRRKEDINILLIFSRRSLFGRLFVALTIQKAVAWRHILNSLQKFHLYIYVYINKNVSPQERTGFAGSHRELRWTLVIRCRKAPSHLRVIQDCIEDAKRRTVPRCNGQLQKITYNIIYILIYIYIYIFLFYVPYNMIKETLLFSIHGGRLIQWKRIDIYLT